MTRGCIYLFNTAVDSSIFKAGHTQQQLRKRLNNYTGPNKVRTLFFARDVDDSVHAEKMMLNLLRQYRGLKWRNDLGNEWFQAEPAISSSDRESHLLQIADVVQLAARVFPTAAPPVLIPTAAPSILTGPPAVDRPDTPTSSGPPALERPNPPEGSPFLLAAMRSPYFTSESTVLDR